MTAPRIAIGLVLVALVGAASRLGAQVDGHQRWSFKVGGFVYSSPAVASDGTVYVGAWDDTSPTRGRVWAFNPAGTPLWQFPSKPTDPQLNAVESSPALGPDGTVYFGCDDGKLYALDGKTGALKWAFYSGAAEIFCSPTISADGGTIYVVSSDFMLHAVTSGGTQLWSHTAGALLSIDTAAAIGADGTIYIGAPDQYVYALTPDNIEKWRVSVGAALISSPAIGPDGTIYLGDSDHNLVAIAPGASAAAVKWRYLAGDLILAQPSIAADGTIYFGSLDGYFYAVNPSGSLKWKMNMTAPIISTAAVRADGTIIFGANDYKIHALNPTDGSSKWPVNTLDFVQTSPVISPDGSIYAGSLDGRLYAIDGTVAPLSGFSSWPMFNHDIAHSGRARAGTAGGYLINLSTLTQAGGSAPPIVGFVVQGSTPKQFLIRAVGPTLGATRFNIPGMLADPAVSVVYAPTNAEVAANDNWSEPDSENFLQVVKFTRDTFSLELGFKDAAVAPSLIPGRYSAVVTATDRGTGLALLEVYDAEKESSASRLINLSTRAQAGSGAGVLTAGLVIGGEGTLRVLLRAIGPGLAQFGVGGFLARPSMTLYDSASRPIGGNTGWTSGGLTEDLAAAARLTGAFSISAVGAGTADCAAVFTLTPGTYTVQVSGLAGTSGVALVEVYVVP